MSGATRLAAALAVLVVTAPAAFSSGERPGEFDYYALILSWSPTYCATRAASGPNEPQCRGDRPYAFVLHGFWPQYRHAWPESCETGQRPWVPDTVVKDMLDIMPSKQLIIHEYRKHGTCSGLSARDYFRASRKAYETIRIPPRFQIPQDYQTVSPGEIESEFLKANPGLKPEMISIDCKNRRLRELRICFSRDLQLTSCGANERQDKLCTSDKVVMPPVRAGASRNGDEDRYDDDDEGGNGDRDD